MSNDNTNQAESKIVDCVFVTSSYFHNMPVVRSRFAITLIFVLAKMLNNICLSSRISLKRGHVINLITSIHFANQLKYITTLK